MKSKKFPGQLIKLGLVGLSLYLISTGLSYAAFSTFTPGGTKQVPKLATPTPNTKQGHFKIDPSIPKTEVCPINGQMYTKQEKDKWSVTRPIFAMIENSVDARPQSGLSQADVVYEAIAEGGITRFGAVFYCGSAYSPSIISPVRSIRIYYLNMATEYGDRPILMHAGGANDFSGEGNTDPKVRALEAIQTLGWGGTTGVDFDATNNMGLPVFYRDENRLGHPVATEHTVVGRLDKAIETATKRGWTNVSAKGVSWDKSFVSWKFADDVEVAKRPASQKISFAFSTYFSDDYKVDWTYDPTNNAYKRSVGNEPHKDLENDEQLTAKNVIVQFMREEVSIDENKHMYYEVTGTGTGLVFQNGQVYKVNWKKPTRQSRTIFTDQKTGKEITIVRGPVWIEFLGIGSEVQY
jgi:hypothetical protein